VQFADLSTWHAFYNEQGKLEKDTLNFEVLNINALAAFFKFSLSWTAIEFSTQSWNANNCLTRGHNNFLNEFLVLISGFRIFLVIWHFLWGLKVKTVRPYPQPWVSQTVRIELSSLIYRWKSIIRNQTDQSMADIVNNWCHLIYYNTMILANTMTSQW